MPFRVVDANIGLDVDISVRCNGSYSYRIVNPLLFYKNVCGNVDEPYRREQIDGQLKSELLTALQPAFARISAMGVRYSAVPAHTKELAQALNEELSDTWSDLRGIEVASFGVNSIAASPEDEDMIKQLQKAAVMRDPTMAAANLAAAQSDAMRAAASNEAGAAVGFMGMGMAGAMGGMNGADLYGRGGAGNGAAQQSAYQQAPGGGFGGAAGAGVAAGVGAAAGAAGTDGGAGAGGWTCPACGTANTGKFCGECGTPRPVAAQAEWRCPSCGATNTGKFCGECGTPRP